MLYLQKMLGLQGLPLMAAINEISESEVHRSQNDSEHVSVDGREYHTWRELADAFELDIHDFSVSEVNR
ncbi:YodD family protein [Escherichia coli]|uniref:YodD family protein n=1 Tax=Escherichia coli TaxID=562 RepID=UPI003D9A3B41